MQCEWDRLRIPQLDALKLEFSALQAGRICDTLKNDSTMTVAK